jgi:cell division protein FtsQ
MSADAAIAAGGKAPRKIAKKSPPKAGPPAARGVSKMAAARSAGLPPRLALAASLLILALVAVAVLATGGRGAALVEGGRCAFETRFASLGFSITDIHLQGASPAAQGEILAAANLKPGQPILGLDLNAVRASVEKVGWVDHARVIRLLPDTVVIAVDQRPLMAVWEHGGRAMVVANNGAVVSQVDPAHFTALPLVVGDGANLAASAILPQIQSRPRLAARLESMIRVDGRRWNLRLKDGGLIFLPAEAEGAALTRLDDLDRTSRILDLGLARIDLRDPEMVVVRPRQAVEANAGANDMKKSGA